MAPDGAALETGARHSHGVSSQVGTQPSPTRALPAFTHVDGTGRSGPAAPLRWVALWSPLENEVSASLLARFATANDIGLCQQTGCPPASEGFAFEHGTRGATFGVAVQAKGFESWFNFVM